VFEFGGSKEWRLVVRNSAQSGGCLHLGDSFCFNFILLIKDLTTVSPQILIISYRNKGRNIQEGRNIPL